MNVNPNSPSAHQDNPSGSHGHVSTPQGIERKHKLPTSPNAPRPNSYMLCPKVPNGQIFITSLPPLEKRLTLDAKASRMHYITLSHTRVATISPSTEDEVT